MKRCGVVLALLVLVVVATAYPRPNPDKAVGSKIAAAAVDKAIRQQSTGFVNYVHAVAGKPLPWGSSEELVERIVASVPESLRQDMANELKAGGDAGGALSEESKERLSWHIIEWSLQYVPEDLQMDIAAVLREFRATQQVSGNNEQLSERIRQYISSLKAGQGNQRFWSELVLSLLTVIVERILN